MNPLAQKVRNAWSMNLQTRFLVLLVALLLMSLVLNAFWINLTQRSQAEHELLEKAEVLVVQTKAVWEFMDINQNRIDTDANGAYNFKGIYCVIAGKTIAAFFERDTDYTIRFINAEPRRKTSYPDTFEMKAFDAIADGASEYYGYGEYEDEAVFRYVKPVYMAESCLECHGEPAGEVDLTGYRKEGRTLGDLGGAVSVAIPTEVYLNDIRQNILHQTAYFFVVILIVVATVFFAMKYLFIRPIAALQEAADQVGQGHLDVSLRHIGGQAEIRDLTLQFQNMILQLKSLYEDLESQVRLRTKQLEDANALLEEQRSQLASVNELLRDENQFKSDFLAIMSHELRTPLTAIIAFSELHERRNKDASDDDLMEIREIRENGQLLLQMVNNILETARMEAGKTNLELEPVDMDDLIAMVASTAGFLAKQRAISFRAHVDPDVPMIDADWEKIRRIVENLVSNAIKFTDEGGCVTLVVSWDESANEVVVCVEDNGAGIPEEALPRIFERYVQNQEPSYKHYGDSGSGLGLAVVKELVEMHRGRVGVESCYGQGSKFTVYLPVSEGKWGRYV